MSHEPLTIKLLIISQFQSFKIPQFQNLQIRDLKVAMLKSVEVPQFQVSKIKIFETLGKHTFPNFRCSRCSEVQEQISKRAIVIFEQLNTYYIQEQ